MILNCYFYLIAVDRDNSKQSIMILILPQIKQRYPISYEFKDCEDQKIGENILIEQYESRGIENRTETYEVHLLVFMIHNEVETVLLRLILQRQY